MYRFLWVILKGWWELFYVRSILFEIFLFSCFLVSSLSARENLFENATSVWKNPPVNDVDPGIAMAYWWSNEVDTRFYAASGNWEYHAYRGAFRFMFNELDSLYRNIEGNLETSFIGKYFGFGGLYGLSMEWVPQHELWARHRYSFGMLGKYADFSVELWMEGFTDEPAGFYAGMSWMPSKGFSFFAEYAGSQSIFGYLLCGGFFCLESSVRVPGFAVSVGANLVVGSWSAGGFHWFGGKDLDWTGFWVHKGVKK